MTEDTQETTAVEDVPLHPFIVFQHDARWAACIEELRSGPRLVGLDTEFFESPELRAAAEASGRDLDKKGAFDPWSTSLRLMQVGLPSGLVMIFDFGPVFDATPYELDGSLAAALAIVGSRTTSKVGVALSTEALILRRHFGVSLRRGRDIMLGSQVVWAGVAAKKARFTREGKVSQEPLSHSYKAVAERLGVQIDKTEQFSDWGAPVLTNRQYNYAALDVHTETLIETWKRLCEVAQHEGVMQSVLVECNAAPAFWECEFRGAPLDGALCAELAADYNRTADELLAFARSELGCELEGPGSQAAVAFAMSKRLGRAMYYWKQGVGEKGQIRAGDSMTPEEAAKVDPGPKPRKPSKKASQAEHDAYPGLLAEWERKKALPSWRLIPQMGEKFLAEFDSDPVVAALMEARSCRSTGETLAKRLRNSWADPSTPQRLATRCRYWQIAGSFDAGRDAADSGGAGMGRSSCGKPLNNQNVTSLPLGKKRHDELGLRNARLCVAPPPGRAMIVGDFSQAHMRFAAQVSGDPALCDDFRAGRDAHIRLAREFALALGMSDPTAADADKRAALLLMDFAAWCDAYQQGKKHPLFYLIKELRRPAKTGNYTSLNLGSPDRLRLAAETDAEPLHLPQTVPVFGGKDLLTGDPVTRHVDPWALIRDRWREVNATLYAYQRDTVKRANRVNRRFTFADGEYGAVWSACNTRRLFLLKEWNIPAWAESEDDGRYSVKGTDAVSAVWMMSEANALKIACDIVTIAFDEHPEWDAFVFNIVHDELNVECAYEHRDAVARVVFDAMQEGLRRAGLLDIPTCAPDDEPSKMLVKSWAEK